MKRIIVLLVVVLSFNSAYSNTPPLRPAKDTRGFNSRLNFAPLIANPFEGRVGAMYQFSDNKLRLDIGNSLDLLKLNEVTNDYLRITDRIMLGADFFTFTRLRSEGNFKFPVETSDYYFGINFTGNKTIMEDSDEVLDACGPDERFKLSYRLRLAHISSHVVDGLADTSGLLQQKPFVYSREFADFVGTIEGDNLRTYGGLTFVWATQPRDANRLIPQLGLEYKERLSGNFQFLAGYDFKLIGISDKYVGTHAAQAGVNYISEKGMPAISLNIYGYHGRSMHGMFYKEKDAYIGTGFQFLF